MRKRIAFFLACMLMSSLAFAQTKVTGTVVSAEDGEPIPGAQVVVEGTKTGVVTDANGKFALTVPANAKQLEISCAGMVPQKVGVKPNISVSLEVDNKALDEVMVVAFGQQTKESFTGSASVVKAEDLQKNIVANPLNALVGKVPGFQMRAQSGAPGAGNATTVIRGLTSLYSDIQPLIIVDGAPYYASLANIPPDDIESMTVLKDAASAALYGAAGAAGVILVTTKRGKTKDAVVNATMSWGSSSRAIQEYKTMKNPAQYYETYYKAYYDQQIANGRDPITANQNANTTMLNNLAYNVYTLPDGQYLIGTNGKLNPNATLGRAYQANGETYYLTPDDWTDEAFHNGFRQEYNVNVSAGSSQGSFFASVGYLNEDGIVDYYDYERFNARLKADYQAKKWLKVGANIGYTHSTANSNPNFGSLMSFTSHIAPIFPIWVRTLDPSGKPVVRTDEYGHPQYDYGVAATNYPGLSRGYANTTNPLGSNRYDKVQSVGHALNQTYTADIKFTDWLRFNSTNNLNLGVSQGHSYGNPFYGNTKSDHGSLTKTMQTNFRQDYIQTLVFEKQFGQHDLQVQLGHEYNKTHMKYLNAQARNGYTPDVQEIDAFGDRYDSSSSTSTFNREGYFGNVLYNYATKYFVSANYRRDGSSYFHPDHRWGNFGSFGAAWLINKEDFMKDQTWIDQLKLKFSNGWQGNDNIGNWFYTDRYVLDQAGKEMLPTFSGIGNPDVTWETTISTNVGVEFSLWKGRLMGGIDFYNKKTKDLLFWLNIPESNGSRGYYGNIGDIRNRGVEVELSADLVRTQNVTWNFGLNLAHNRTKVLKLPESKKADHGGFAQVPYDTRAGYATGLGSSGTLSCWFEEGKPLNNALIYEYAGVYNENTYQLTGDAQYDPKKGGMAMYWADEDMIDPATNGAITSYPGKKHSFATTNTALASRYEQGTMLPKLNGGFNTTLKIFDFDITAMFDYQIGGKVYDSQYSSLMSVPTLSSIFASTWHKDILKAWTPENSGSNIPRLQAGDEYATSTSTRFLTKASYLNFQSFSVGYTFPKRLTQKIHIDKLRLYCQGQNLCFVSARKGLDPRYAFGEMPSSAVYSPVRTITWGIQATF